MASDTANIAAGQGRFSFSGRLIGIDLARFVAVTGMVAAHLVAPYLDGGWIVAVTSGFPAALFAVLGGFGSFFASRRYLIAGQKRAALVSLMTRGTVIAAIGLALEWLPDHRIAVVLVYYGVALVIFAPLVLLPTVGLLSFVGVFLVANPFLLFAFRSVEWGFRVGFMEYSQPTSFLVSVFFTGAYPVFTWVTYMGMGLLLARPLTAARSPIDRRAIALKGLLAGSAISVSAYVTGRLRLPRAALILEEQYRVGGDEALHYLTAGRHGGPLLPGPDALLALNPHSGSAVDLLITGGAALSVISLFVLVTGTLQRVPIWLAVVAKAGGTPLTIYVGHIILTAYAYDWAKRCCGAEFGVLSGADPWWITWGFLVQMALALGLAGLLYKTHKRGPLESFTSELARGVADRLVSS